MTGVDGILLPTSSTPIEGKKVSDLIGKDVKVGPDGSVSGTLPYVPEYPGFSSDSKEQSGYYFPVYIDRDGDKITTVKDGVTRTATFPDDHLLVARLNSQNTTLKISVDDTEITTLNFSGATLAAPLGKDAFNDEKTDYGGFGNNETYYKGGKVEIAWNGTDATVTGELNWLDESALGKFSKLKSNGNYFAFSLTEWFKGKEITVGNGGKVSTASDTDWVCLVSEGKKSITVKCGETTIATYDLSGAKLAPGEP